MLDSKEIRSRFLAFFEKRGHAIITSASLVPENDPSVLFNTAGMQPLVPYLLGESHPQGTRLVNSQKCVRTVDIDEIGDNTHATFFEMLGNWSLGDYFKKDAITWSYEFLTSKEEGLGLDPARLYITVFGGNADAPKDDEAWALWKNLFEQSGVSGERIYFMTANTKGKEPNWWSAGDNGPCGPDSEMFYDVTGTLTKGMSKEEYMVADEHQSVVEIWNDVFMEYLKKDGKVIGKLEKQNVDTGSGLERITMVVQGKSNIFETDLLAPIIEVINEHAQHDDLRARRIIADHIRTSVFLIGDGVLPSNTDQGYILRRLIRRAVRYMDALGIREQSPKPFVRAVVKIYAEAYPNLSLDEVRITQVIEEEGNKFRKTLEHGIKEIEKLAEKHEGSKKEFSLRAEVLFDLYQTHGFPVEMSFEEINQIRINDGGSAIPEDVKTHFIALFRDELKKHQDVSRKGSEQKFKGGLADTSEMSVKYHTATHLLHEALRQVLGEHVLQKGSNITPERLRFDFSHGAKMTDEQKAKVEKIVNDVITEGLPVTREEVSYDEARARGAIGVFDAKYGDIVSIYTVGQTGKRGEADLFSLEFCGGPHVKNTNELGKFKIVKEEACSLGIRRIKAVLE